MNANAENVRLPLLISIPLPRPSPHAPASGAHRTRGRCPAPAAPGTCEPCRSCRRSRRSRRSSRCGAARRPAGKEIEAAGGGVDCGAGRARFRYSGEPANAAGAVGAASGAEGRAREHRAAAATHLVGDVGAGDDLHAHGDRASARGPASCSAGTAGRRGPAPPFSSPAVLFKPHLRIRGALWVGVNGGQIVRPAHTWAANRLKMDGSTCQAALGAGGSDCGDRTPPPQTRGARAAGGSFRLTWCLRGSRRRCRGASRAPPSQRPRGA